MIKTFQIFKAENKKSDKEPDYRFTAKVDDSYVEIGAGWITTSPKGTKYISCKMAAPYKTKDGKSRSGFEIIEVTGEPEVVPVVPPVLPPVVPTPPAVPEYGPGEINPSDIPF